VSSAATINSILRQNVFQKAKPKAKQQNQVAAGARQQSETASDSTPGSFYEQMPGFGGMNSGAADVFFNKWEVGGLDGSTFGINPSMTWGDTDELTLTLPLHVISPDDGDTIGVIGLDGAYKHAFGGKWENFAAGVHGSGVGYFGGGDNATAFGGGPFVSYAYQIDSKWVVSAGGLLEFTIPDEGDTITEIIPGVNVGYNVSDDLALNGYLVYYRNLDRDGDEGYTDIGADVQWAKGSWSLAGGVKTAAGLDTVESTEIYFGSNWLL